MSDFLGLTHLYQTSAIMSSATLNKLGWFSPRNAPLCEKKRKNVYSLFASAKGIIVANHKSQ